MRLQRFRTLHPDGRQGTNIERSKYEAMKRALLAVIPRKDPGVEFKMLSDLVQPKLPKSVYGPRDSVRWYATTVKLDLEARGMIRRVPGARPQRVVRVG